MCKKDNRTVMTLTTSMNQFTFTAIREGREVVMPIVLPAYTDHLQLSLEQMEKGFEAVIAQLDGRPDAISFAFAGPADYILGIIDSPPNFPAYHKVPLGPILKQKFGIPVYINNGGNLFAYGEALAGALPNVNMLLEMQGYDTHYTNLIGVTIGTGLGGGIVIDDKLVRGDNGVAAEIWCMPDKICCDQTSNDPAIYDPERVVESIVSARGVSFAYQHFSGETIERKALDILAIAEGKMKGDQAAALHAFERFGESLGHVIALLISTIDGLVVIGGTLTKAKAFYTPSLMKEMDRVLFDGKQKQYKRLPLRVFNLDDKQVFEEFSHGHKEQVKIPGTTCVVERDTMRRVPVMTSTLGWKNAISYGAYAFALLMLDKKKKTC